MSRARLLLGTCFAHSTAPRTLHGGINWQNRVVQSPPSMSFRMLRSLLSPFFGGSTDTTTNADNTGNTARNMSASTGPSAPVITKEFDNSGDGPLYVPGFGAAHNFEFEQYPHQLQGAVIRFTHGVNEWRNRRITVRELAMLRLMDALTDKPDWHVKVFDETIVSKWRAEATAMPLISEKAWEWCVLELRDKARRFEEEGTIITLDTGSRIVKSNVLVGEDLRKELIAGVEPLLSVPQEKRDYHPGSDDLVLNLVHPSLFPLVYGTTRVLTKGGRVDVNDVFTSVGLGEVAPVPENTSPPQWSSKFQWLPCDAEFTGETGTDVRITSYINNLHPEKHAGLYRAVEKLIGLSVPLWNDVLIRQNDGRTPLRIITYGAEMEPAMPDWADAPNMPKTVYDEGFPELFEKVRAYLAQPDHPEYEPDPDEEEEEEDDESDEDEDGDIDIEDVPNREEASVADKLLRRLTKISDGPSDKHYSFKWDLHYAIERKWKRIRHLLHPEPGQAFSYEDWKKGELRAVVKRAAWHSKDKEDNRERPFPYKFYDVSLENEFRAKGLQVITKLASIELTPEKPRYSGGSWHVEGMLNEHIVATAIYYYDVENVTDARLAFRQEASLDDMELVYEQDEHEPLAEIFGCETMRDEPAVQNLGEVTTPQGRLLVFPNTLQHKVGNFELVDATKPGHRRFVVLWLVDPNYRVCSTKNVPPQQHEWWAEKRLANFNFGNLPQEIVNMVSEDVKDYPMGLDEAKKLRLELMEERTLMTGEVENGFEFYNLCEH